MDVVELTKNLIKIPSYVNNNQAIQDCINYCINYFKDNKKVFIKKEEKNGSPSVLLSNVDTINLDVLDVGHIDVMPVNDNKMFEPRIEKNIMYGRGTSDMKDSVAVSIKTLEYVIENNLPIKYGTLIVSDEETGGHNGAKHWAEDVKLKTKILLDGDSGASINTIIQKSKGAIFLKLISHGKTAHGSRPWLGIDANENLINTIVNLRKVFPYYCEDNHSKEDEWITTMHVGKINGGSATNIIADQAEACIDIRFTEEYNTDKILKIMKESIVGNIDVEIGAYADVIITPTDNKYLQLYKNSIEKVIGDKGKFNFTTVATDARYFYNKNTTIIPNQPTGGDIHNDGEWVDIETIKQFLEIKKDFLNNLVSKNYL